VTSPRGSTWTTSSKILALPSRRRAG
jgi:hypothetical protein